MELSEVEQRWYREAKEYRKGYLRFAMLQRRETFNDDFRKHVKSVLKQEYGIAWWVIGFHVLRFVIPIILDYFWDQEENRNVGA